MKFWYPYFSEKSLYKGPYVDPWLHGDGVSDDSWISPEQYAQHPYCPDGSLLGRSVVRRLMYRAPLENIYEGWPRRHAGRRRRSCHLW